MTNKQANGDNVSQCYYIEAGDFAAAGEAASSIKRLLKQLGIDGSIVRRAAIAAYEAEMNLVIHSLGGSLEITVSPEQAVIIAQDRGPGIEDIEIAMQEGFSTASEHARELGFGAGMGLPNIKRCSDGFDIKSEVGKGTWLKITFNLQ
jgi:serine/threonine-protein kinase RsbT